MYTYISIYIHIYMYIYIYMYVYICKYTSPDMSYPQILDFKQPM